MDRVASHTLSSNSPGALISGVPSVVSEYENLIEDFHTVVAEATSRAVNTYQSHLRNTARQKGWGESADAIKVNFDRSRLEISVSGDQSMEYGQEGQAPKPVVRNVLTRITELESLITRELTTRKRGI